MKPLFETKNLAQVVTRLQLALALVATLFTAENSRADESGPKEFNYDPTSCKADAHGKLYIALGRNVLGLPSAGAVIVARYGNGWLKPPDPADALGCPDNPEQLTGYGFPYAYNATVERGSSLFSGKQPQVDSLQLIDIHGNSDVRSADDTEWRLESFETNFAQSICNEEVLQQHQSEGWAVIHENLSNGFTACRLKHGDQEPRIEDMRAAYIARSEFYQTPLGRPFAVNCFDHMYTLPVGDCIVAYVFSLGLGVTYKFHLYHAARVLPMDQVINFDHALRAAIDAALVKDYRWPEEAEKAAE